jgi:hypothetical protein
MGAMCASKASVTPPAAPAAPPAAEPALPSWPFSASLVRLRCLIDGGDLEAVQALVESDGRFDMLRNTNPFEVACEAGQLRIAQWALDRDRAWLLALKFDCAFRQACRRGHVGVIEWLLSLVNELPYQFGVDTFFALLCGYGSLDILQCLRARVPLLDIHAHGDEAFTQACKEGRLDVAQWLHAQGGVDIHARHDAAFVLACMNRRLREAQWLWSLGGVDPHTLDEWVARSCKVWRHMNVDGKTASPLICMAHKVCQWVLSLDPREAAWPEDMVAFVQKWSPARDAWMRSVCARVPFVGAVHNTEHC